MSLATFGAGCFWGVEKSFKKRFPQVQASVGYCGGSRSSVSYREVCSGTTGFAEVVQIRFDESKVPYESLVDFFYRMHDPTQLNSQGNDHGTQYRSAIFYHSDAQKIIAERVTRESQEHFGAKKIQTVIQDFAGYVRAEDYHQAYLDANPHGYECASHFERTWAQIEKQVK